MNSEQNIRGSLFSVVVPVLNEEKYVEPLVKGIHDQSYRPIEVVIVDGGSRDHTLEILDYLKLELDSTDFKIRVLQESAGVGRQRNRGLAASSGDYIVFLDADMLPGDRQFLAKIGRALHQDPVAAYVCEVKGETWWERNLAADYELATEKWSKRTPPNAFQRKSLRGINWDSSLGVGEDIDFINQLRAALNIERVEPVAKLHCHLPHTFKEYSVRYFWYGSTLIPFLRKYAQWRVFFSWAVKTGPFVLVFLIPLIYFSSPVIAFALSALLVSGIVYRLAGSRDKNLDRFAYLAISTLIGSFWFSLGLIKGLHDYLRYGRVSLGRPELW